MTGDSDIFKKRNAVGYSECLEAREIEVSEQEEKRLRWKLDLIILPMFLITYTMQLMDRTSLNYANLFGYQGSLGLKGVQFNWLSGMVYATYFVGEYPCGWIIGMFPAQRVVAISTLLWGVTMLVMTQTRTYSSALAIRFIMGVFEAAVTPGLTLMTGFWYTRREIPLRQCIWISSVGLGGIIGSYISMGVSRLPEDMEPERWELIIYILGGVTCLWAPVVWIFLPDPPVNARFLNNRERLVAVNRVAANGTGIKNKAFDKKQIRVGLLDPKTILVLSALAGSVPNTVISSFSTIIIRDMGFSTTKTTQLKSAGDAFQIVALVIGGSIILNIPNSRLIVATVVNLICTVSAACMAYFPRSNTWGRLAGFWIINIQSVAWSVALTTISSNMAGYTHRSLASAMIFTAWCWGNFAGLFVVQPSQAPHLSGATIGMMVGYAVKMACHFLLLVYIFWSNKRRDRVYGAPDKEKSIEAGMMDMTEFQNKNFRYVL